MRRRGWLASAATAYADAPAAGFAGVVAVVTVVLVVVTLTSGPGAARLDPAPDPTLAPVVGGAEPVAAADAAGLARQIAVAEAVRGNLTARRALLDMSTGPPASTLPAWRIVEPWAPERLRAAYAEAQARFGVPWTVLAPLPVAEWLARRGPG